MHACSSNDSCLNYTFDSEATQVSSDMSYTMGIMLHATEASRSQLVTAKADRRILFAAEVGSSMLKCVACCY